MKEIAVEVTGYNMWGFPIGNMIMSSNVKNKLAYFNSRNQAEYATSITTKTVDTFNWIIRAQGMIHYN